MGVIMYIYYYYYLLIWKVLKIYFDITICIVGYVYKYPASMCSGRSIDQTGHSKKQNNNNACCFSGVNFLLAPTPDFVQTFSIHVIWGTDYGKNSQSWRK